MASFAEALNALAQGRLKADLLIGHMERTLGTQPELLPPLLRELAQAYEQGLIEAQTFAKLKAQARRIAQGAVPQPATMTDSDGAADDAEASIEIGDLDIDLEQIILDARQQDRPVSFAVGTVIKERFALEEILGAGGMGTVYKARDLLKVEARDRHPFVAIKVLNDGFRHHRHAFISLQREASRQQKLAHPNIATVYDFDRSGDTVYLTMEYLQGQALNSFLRRQVRPRGGLPFDEAMPIIRGLGQALAYAHERDIVHSDFKPANCFLTDSGTVKVLDFGIARVMQTAEDAEKTVHDPGSLGALTPAYASPEMLQGEAPDPRDDVYALGCVAYELLSGKHPYDRKSATIAVEQNMEPLSIPALGRSQMRALSRAVALKRDQRTPDINSFLEELQKASRTPRLLWVSIAAMLLIVAAVLIWR